MCRRKIHHEKYGVAGRRRLAAGVEASQSSRLCIAGIDVMEARRHDEARHQVQLPSTSASCKMTCAFGLRVGLEINKVAGDRHQICMKPTV